MTERTRTRGAKWGAIAALGSFMALAASPLPTAWQHWRYSRRLQLPEVQTTALVGLLVPEEVYTREAAPGADLRIIDDEAREVPFSSFTRNAMSGHVSLVTIVHEKSFTPGQYTQIVMEVPRSSPFHNAVQFQTPEQNFIAWVRVEASDDARTWRIVQDRAPIFRFRDHGREGTQEVHYSENNAKFLRASILNGDYQFPVTDATVIYDSSVAAERAPLSANLAQAPTSPAGETLFTADFGGAHAPIYGVRFGVAPPTEFSRNVRLEYSADNSQWAPATSGEIYRFRQDDVVQEGLSVGFEYSNPESRYWRVTIENGNDAPLAGVTAQFLTAPLHILFERKPGRSYRLLYGQSEAEPAQYDLERRLSNKEKDAAVVVALGPEEENTAWSDPRPMTEKHEFVLWVFVGLAVLILGYSAVHSLRKSTGARRE
jgi:hypothetical protein